MIDHAIKRSNDNWKYRRNLLFIVIGWAMAMITYLLIFAKSDPLRDAAIVALTGLLATLVTAYVFGAVTDDYLTNKKKEEANGQNP